ncbi:hypothetical protein QAD02_013501 [Eretmocerus hayati]|uniref:Uncharacterized protein n=1 Tax=Eretmocerus hayati TaxID=131215 RepID=A0ACC2P314_9HYME|nr:hypothetical protein QAD02_013501 [Eretmocerus hayati]
MDSQKRVRKYRYKRRIMNAIRTRGSELILSSDDSEHGIDGESLHVINKNFSIENDIPIELPENITSSLGNDTGYNQISSDGCSNSSSSSDWESSEDHTSVSSRSDTSNGLDQETPHGSYGESDSESNKSVWSSSEEPEIMKIRQWSLEYRIAGVHVDALLKILNERPLFKLPNSHKTLLGYNRTKYSIKDMMSTDNTLGEFTYLGIERGLETCVNPLLHAENTLLLDFHIDGMKLKKSSARSLWVVLAKVYLADEPNSYKPFPVSLFYGNGKPQNLGDYLDEFVREINNLIITVVKIKSKRFMIQLRCFICDIPARAFVEKIKEHSSFNGCERCNIHAHKHDGTVTYLEKNTVSGDGHNCTLKYALPDNTVLLNNGSMVKIEKICVVGEELKLQVLDLKKRNHVYQNPCESSFLNICGVESYNVNARLRFVTLDAIQTKMIRFSLNFAPDTEMRTFVVPLLH